MNALRPNGSTAVMQRRREPPDALDFFPTPPWATRALLEHVLLPLRLVERGTGQAWEPACGEGHMSAVLEEYFATVIATDVFDYSGGDPVRWPTGWWKTLDFLDRYAAKPSVDWLITNPPFQTAEEFAIRGLFHVSNGLALLVRTSWLEGASRYNRLFRDSPPAIIAQFVERVPMLKGRWDPEASTATSYCWVIWLKALPQGGTVFIWIPPGQREALTKPSDIARFAPLAPAPLLDGCAA